METREFIKLSVFLELKKATNAQREITELLKSGVSNVLFLKNVSQVLEKQKSGADLCQTALWGFRANSPVVQAYSEKFAPTHLHRQ